MLGKINTHFEQLVAVFDAIDKDHVKKAAEKKRRADEMEAFIEGFLRKVDLRSVASSGRYVHCINETFIDVSEDELQCIAYRYILGQNSFSLQNYALVRYVLKKVKNRPFLGSRPSEATQKVVLDYFSGGIFATADEAVYFLCVVGEVLIGKRALAYFANPSFRPLVETLDQLLGRAIDKTLSESFKYKYHEHDFASCRILQGECPEFGPVPFNGYELAVVAVAFCLDHTSSDLFLETSRSPLAPNVFRLRDTNRDQLAFDFLLQHTSKNGATPFKDIVFSWKTFLYQNNIPCVMTKPQLKDFLKKNELYNPETDQCPLTLLTPPCIYNLDNFWLKNMKSRKNDRYHVDEICALYNTWCDANLKCTLEQCGEYLRRKFPAHTNDAFVDHFYCVLWDKKKETEEFLDTAPPGEGIDELYRRYTEKNQKRSVKKEYMEFFMAKK